MLKIILATLVSFSAVAFAEGTEPAPTAPTGTEAPAAPKADKKAHGKTKEMKHKKGEHKE